jgi:hypothetical protein
VHILIVGVSPILTTTCNAPQYKNVRPDYLKNIWKVVNWKDVGERLAEAKK